MITSDNAQLNKLAKTFTLAITATNKALENDAEENEIEKLEDAEDVAQNAFISYIHSMLPKGVLEGLKADKKIRLYNAKVIDKYIHSQVA